MRSHCYRPQSVAWFVLQCTLLYSQSLAGQHRPLPRFALESTDFMEQFFRSTGKLTTKQLERNLSAVQERLFPAPEVDLAGTSVPGVGGSCSAPN